MTGRSRTERGAGTILVVTTATVLLTMAIVMAACVGLLHAHRRAQAAADLAALAGAAALQQGADGCGQADEVAALNGASLVRCRVTDRRVRVVAGVRGPAWGGFDDELLGEAEAGPS
ncbi:Rv3654c family TadE-like protein [Nocardioides daphniae]|uniref:Uncharacterized protein n=1 Tax=Nocardioides daphniae TaxID=402297 RepID=A0A4P7UE03_9ACTN|nr:Rv3654c family TadE-like protein [Nocardioides daphniae]QCC78346.1 hypothetical protein E2C04_16155 [Nocardioides daphniae]GGD13359.1 hypothetical protein GCM10007231_10480 [Nocardioides daphniae]